MEMLLGIFSAFGLWAGAELNAYIPLLVVGTIAHYFPQTLALGNPWDLLANPWILLLLGVLVLIEMVPIKSPRSITSTTSSRPWFARQPERSPSRQARTLSLTSARLRAGMRSAHGGRCACGQSGGGTSSRHSHHRRRRQYTGLHCRSLPSFMASVFAVLLPIVMGTVLVILFALVLWWLWRRTDKPQSA